MDEKMKQHGAFSWMELMTTDVAKAKSFYSSVFGWETAEYEGGPMPYTMVKVGGDEVGGMMSMPPHSEGMHPAWSIYVTVDDVDATASKVTELGGQVVMGPQDIPDVGRFCLIQDPQGAFICAITYKAM
ncbi:MAG: VOC family protein [Desulfosarcinaceae bacterium]|nr:VOC family protein [Desulfosarcinaceae bacterium]